jgi:hemolysin III
MENPKPHNLHPHPFLIHEEIANTFIHALGIIFGLAGVPVLILYAIKNNDVNNIIASSVYGFSFLMTFTSSTLYHSCFAERRKCIYKVLDYVSIYFLIAGTYTPFILRFMQNDSGIFLLSTVWLCTLAGAFFKIFFVNRYLILTVCFYLFMGLLFLIKCNLFFASMPYTIGFLIVCGVVLYVIGVTFFLWQKWYYHHAIWHTFVLIASICHFIAVLLTIKD